MKKTAPFKYDESWMLLVKCFTQPFLEFMYPELASNIDFNIPIEFKEKELLDLKSPPHKFSLKVDNLLKVTLKDKTTPTFVLVHVEVEANNPHNLLSRMFFYYMALNQIYVDFSIYPLIIYIGYKPFNSTEFVINSFNFKLQFSCCYYDINRYSEEDYIGSSNPFTIFLLISIWMNKYRQKKIGSKREIITELKKELTRRSMTEDFYIFLRKFVKKVLSLSKEDDKILNNIITIKTKDMYEIANNFQAKAILDSEVRMFKEGKTLETFILEGKLEGKVEIAKSLKKQGVAIKIIAQATGLSIDAIEKL
ncbi:MAG: hypothetical protein ORN85_01330 [Sediminibacterium sp.]|nr:hypothetical protein [Sediminibacterium sp.]